MRNKIYPAPEKTSSQKNSSDLNVHLNSIVNSVNIINDRSYELDKKNSLRKPLSMLDTRISNFITNHNNFSNNLEKGMIDAELNNNLMVPIIETLAKFPKTVEECIEKTKQAINAPKSWVERFVRGKDNRTLGIILHELNQIKDAFPQMRETYLENMTPNFPQIRDNYNSMKEAADNSGKAFSQTKEIYHARKNNQITPERVDSSQSTVESNDELDQGIPEAKSIKPHG